MIALIVLLPSFAAAADAPELPVDGQLYRLPVDARATMWADDSTVTPGAGAKAGAGWVHEPVVWVWEDTGERVPLVDDAVALDVIGSYAFWRIRGGVDVPLYLYAAGDAGTGPGLGDMGIDLKGMILDPKEMPVGLGLSVRMDLPTGFTAVPLSPDGLGWEAAVILDQQFGPVLVAANVGTRGTPEVATTNTTVSNQLAWRLAAGYNPGANWGLSLDLAGWAEWSDLGNAGSAPAEAMLGGWFRVADRLRLQAGVGHGLSRGIGASNGRAVLAIAWEPAEGGTTKPTPKPVSEKPAPVVEKPAAVVEKPVAEKPKPVEKPVVEKPLPVEKPTVTVEKAPPVVVPVPVVAPVVAEPVLSPKEPVAVGKNRLLLYQRIAFDGASLRAEGAQQLDGVTRFLANHPEIEMIRIEGHTDGRGDPSDELALAGTRAGIVLEYLAKRGLSRERFYAAGYGGMRPLVTGGDESARITNERIEFVITQWAEGHEPQ